MEDSDGVLNFDFEGGLDAAATTVSATAGPANTGPASNYSVMQSDSAVTGAGGAGSNQAAVAQQPNQNANRMGGRSYRQTVCRHWLRSLCMKGEACGFLHQYDKSRMPVCRFFRLYGECREQDCVYKHTNEDIKECNMYKLGFCPNGPDCRYRHAKLPGPPPPVEEVLQKIQHLNSYNYNNSNKFYQQRNAGFPQQGEKYQPAQGPNNFVGKPTTAESGNVQQQQQLQQTQQQVGPAQTQNLPSGLANQANRSALPLPQGTSRYFIVKSCNRENLELSVQQGVWATQRSNESKLNEAFDSAENVILIFSVNRTRHFQGCAKMMSRIGGSVGGGNWKYAHGTAHYGRNFSVKWLKLCELSFHKTRHLRNPYNENLPVKISRDCQELEQSIGEQLASLLYLEPDSELMAISIAAESKREEEKAKGVNPENGGENPDIVPFEDNEEEEEEESEDEEDSFGQVPGAGNDGRGRGRGGVMWPPHMPLPRGGRPMPGMQGFPPGMMGPDAMPYGPDGFVMPNPFVMGPRGFNPYGPRFSGDFTVPNPGMMFRGRPQQPGFPPGGFGIMGPGRAPFMGGPHPGRGGRPTGISPMFPPPPPLLSQNPNWMPKRDPRGASSDRRGQDMTGSAGGPDDEALYGAGNNSRNDDSDSEDEAPRRSRHGEGKKKRRDSEGDATSEH
ncbi:hypothetical protein COP1_036388 [Malus domestica]